MANDSVIELIKPASFVDEPIADILWQGARKLLVEAFEAEIQRLPITMMPTRASELRSGPNTLKKYVDMSIPYL